MDIGGYLRTVGTGYSMSSMSSEGHVQLRKAGMVFGPFLPGGLIVKASGGIGRATATPWIAFLDPDETMTPQRGIYLVYLFNPAAGQVVLSLTQGITQVQAQGKGAAVQRLREHAARVRETLGAAALEGLDFEIYLGEGYRQRGYSAANIAAIQYSLMALPPEEDLWEDLRLMLRLYQRTTVLRGIGSRQDRPLHSVSSAEAEHGFKPNTRGEYAVHLSGGMRLRDGGRHEALIKEYGEHVLTLGLRPRNQGVYPIDMILVRENIEWIVEAKVVYEGNSRQAVRAAVAQLLEYSFTLYSEDKQPYCVALFTESIGSLYVDFLERHGIGTVWKGNEGWAGSKSALDAGLF